MALKVAECIIIYHQVFITRKNVSSCAMHMASCVHHKEICFDQSCAMYISLCAYEEEKFFGAAQCIYHKVFITRRDVLKLRNVYIIMCSSQGKLFKVVQCINHQVFLARKVVLKLWNVDIITW